MEPWWPGVTCQTRLVLDLFGDELPPPKPPKAKQEAITKDLSPPVAADQGTAERSEQPLYCDRCGSGDLYLPVLGDLQGRTIAGWRCRRCWPDQTDHVLEMVARLRQRQYAKRIRKEEFIPELEEDE